MKHATERKRRKRDLGNRMFLSEMNPYSRDMPEQK